MKTSLASVSVLATLGVAAILGPRSSSTHLPAVTGNAEGTKLISHLPVAFVPNLGQWDSPARYIARVGAMTVFLEENGWTFTLAERTSAKANEEEAKGRGVAVRMTFADAGQPVLLAEASLAGRHNYFLGNDPSKWRSDVPLYGSVRYREMRPGVDVCAREHDGHFEYDLMLEPDADLATVEIAVEGIERMHVDHDDALVLETSVGPVRMPAPLTWEEGPSGEKSLVACRYVLRGGNRFGFEVPGRRADWSLVVDPGLVWSTLLGGTVGDRAHAVAVDAQGAVTVAGITSSTGFPTTAGAFDTTYNVADDCFVTRVSPDGSSLVYSTFVGGTWVDGREVALALDVLGAATITGWTNSFDFPTTVGAFDTTFNTTGRADAFVTQLSPTGSSLVYSTFLGGASDDSAYALALDAQGAAIVVGATKSTDFPVTLGAFDTSHNGGWDVFVARLSPTGSSLVYSTFLGWTGIDRALGVALDVLGTATVVGETTSPNFPITPGAFDTTYNGSINEPYDGFVFRLSPTGSSLIYSTYLGGTGNDHAHGVAVDAQGTATVVGATGPGDFPTTPGAFDTTHNGHYDVFVTRLVPTGSSLLYSTFLGGTNSDGGVAVAVDAQGAATVTGTTSSVDFPTTAGAFDRTFNGLNDALVARLSPAGSSLIYSTYLGGAAEDAATAPALALDSHGGAIVAGGTSSAGFPTTSGGFDTSHNGDFDAFVTRLDMLPTGVAAFGRSSPGCSGPLAISVTSMPRAGNGSFALTCGNAPPSTTGALALAASGLTTPIQLLGIEVWLDPLGAFFVSFPAGSDAVGACDFALPIPNHPSVIGRRLAAQFLWAGPTSPLPCPPLGFSTSHALDITIQP